MKMNRLKRKVKVVTKTLDANNNTVWRTEIYHIGKDENLDEVAGRYVADTYKEKFVACKEYDSEDFNFNIENEAKVDSGIRIVQL